MTEDVRHPTISDVAIQQDSRPLYERAQEALLQLLSKGGYRPGDKLPPEPELARQLGISRATLREALRSLKRRDTLFAAVAWAPL